MAQKILTSVILGLSLLATSVSAANTNAAVPTRSYTVRFDRNDAGSMANKQYLTAEFNDQAARTNFMYVDKVGTSGSGAEAVITSSKFGKTAEDKFLRVTRTDVSTALKDALRIDRNDSANGSWFKNYSAGTKIVQSFSAAFENNASNSYSFALQMTGTTDGENATATVGLNNGTATILKVLRGNLEFFGKKTAFTPISSKWYKFDIVYTVGSETEKNHADLYVDGKPVNSADFTLSKTGEIVPMYGVTLTRFLLLQPESSWWKSGGSAICDMSNYIDDISWTPKGADYVYTQPELQCPPETAVIADGKIALNRDMTAAELRSVLTQENASIEIVSAADGTAVADDADTDGAVLRVTGGDAGTLYYSIGKNSYSEDFEGEDSYSASELSKNFDTVDFGIAEDIGAKTGKSFKIDTNLTAANTSWQHIGTLVKNVGVKAVDGMPIVAEAMYYGTQEDYEVNIIRLAFKGSSGKAYETNVLNSGANGSITAISVPAGVQKQYRWNKAAFVIDPETMLADFYLNGVKMNEEPFSVVSGAAEGEKIVSVEKLYLRTWMGSTLALSGYSAFDDVKVYVGEYDAAGDAAALASSDERFEVGSGYIRIPDGIFVNDLLSALSAENSKNIAVYQDISCEAAYLPFLPLGTGAYLAYETEGGAIHYYEIITESAAGSYEKPTVYIDGVAQTSLDGLEANENTFISAAARVNICRDSEGALLAIAIYKDGTLDNVFMSEPQSSVGDSRMKCRITGTDSFENTQVKAFLWQAGSFMPLTQCTELQ